MTGGHSMARPTVFLEEMTWPEVKAALERGARTVIVPVASVEQHGPALPLATDAIIGRALAEQMATKMGDALVAPPIIPGCSDHHMAWPGTVTMDAGLLNEIVFSYLSSFARHGFREAVVFAAHGGNFGPLSAGLKGLVAKFDPETFRVIGLLDATRFFGEWFRVLRQFGRSDSTLPHADVMETSLILYLRPDLVRLDRIEPGYTGTFELEDIVRKGLPAYTSNGVLGDPRGATPELGTALLDQVSDFMVDEVNRIRAELEAQG